MKSWYQVKFKYIVQNEKGEQVSKTDIWLFDAVSYTDAEARATEHIMAAYPEHQLEIARVKYHEVFVEADHEAYGPRYYKVKVLYVVFDEKNQQDKEVPFMMLMPAYSCKEAIEKLVDKLGTVQDYRFAIVQETKIVGINIYEENNGSDSNQ